MLRGETEMARTVPARDRPEPSQDVQQLLNVWDAVAEGLLPCGSLQEHQLQPGPNKALLHRLHVLGGPDHPQNPATCDPLRSTSAVPSLCPGEPLAASSWEPRPQTPPALPSDALLLPWQPALCTFSSQHSPIRPLFPFPCHLP